MRGDFVFSVQWNMEWTIGSLDIGMSYDMPVNFLPYAYMYVFIHTFINYSEIFSI
jgi:hypothetical protein